MIEFLKSNPEFIVVVVAISAATSSFVTVALNYISSSYLQKNKFRNDVRIQEYLDEIRKHNDSEKVAIFSLKKMIISLQNYRTFVLSFVRNVNFDGIEEDEIYDELEDLVKNVSISYSEIYANCPRNMIEPCHNAKINCENIAELIRNMASLKIDETKQIREYLSQLKEYQDAVRDGVITT